MRDLAERLEVSPRTLRRDIDRLRVLGYPVDATPGVDGGYRLAAGAALPPLVLDDDEAVALVIALRSSATLAISGAAEASVNALAKVVQVLPARLRQRAESVASMTVTAEWSDTLAAVDAGTLATLATTARNVERVEFSYRDRESNTQDRLVEPAQLVMLGRRWYLVAYDVDRHDWRTFRVDRISEPRATGRHFQPKPVPTGDAADYVRSSISLATPSVDIVVEIEAPATDVRHRFGQLGDGDAGRSRPLPPGGVERRVRLADDDARIARSGFHGRVTTGVPGASRRRRTIVHALRRRLTRLPVTWRVRATLPQVQHHGGVRRSARARPPIADEGRRIAGGGPAGGRRRGIGSG